MRSALSWVILFGGKNGGGKVERREVALDIGLKMGVGSV